MGITLYQIRVEGDSSCFDSLQGEPTSVSFNELVLNITDDDELSEEINNILKKYADPKTTELIDKVLKKK